MNVLKILGKGGRMELADLASLFLPVSFVRMERDDPHDDELEEDCEDCEEEDEEVCEVCMLRGIIHRAGQNGRSCTEYNHHRPGNIERLVFPFGFWAEFVVSGSKAGY